MKFVAGDGSKEDRLSNLKVQQSKVYSVINKIVQGNLK